MKNLINDNKKLMYILIALQNTITAVLSILGMLAIVYKSLG